MWTRILKATFSKIALGVWLWCAGVSAQVITTVAGTDFYFPSTPLPAVNAPLGTTQAVAVDAQGNAYAADSSNNIVVRISPNGVLTVVAGNGIDGFSGDGGPATGASLNHPLGVAVDSVGNLYIADSDNERIRKVSGGTITTVAGNGTSGYSGDGGPATSASLWGPSGVAVDSAGNLYIGDMVNNRIRKVSGGTITTVAGNGTSGHSGDGGPATSASLYYPWGVAVDLAGNLYIADTYNAVIRKVSGGTITTVAGGGNGQLGDGGPATSASLNYPTGVALDSAGNLYIADADTQRIRKVSGGTITTVAGNGTYGFSGDGGPATSASLGGPRGVAVDSAGNLYMAELYNMRIRQVSGGTIKTFAGNGAFRYSGDGGPAASASLNYPTGVALDSAGNLYIADSSNNRIRGVAGGTITTIAGNGFENFSGDGGLATSASLSLPEGVAADSAGNLYIADSGNQRIRKVSGGTITTIAGNGMQGFSGDGGPATSASLTYPAGVAVDPAGNLYIADSYNNRIRKVSGGTITTVAGNGAYGFSGDGGPATSASLYWPQGVAVDSAGNLYIADTGNQRIRKVSGGTITTVAGNGAYRYSGDGGPATSASLEPRGVSVDSAGNLYIADSWNSRIREVLAAKPAVQVSTSSLSFSAQATGAPAPTQSFSIASVVPGLGFSLTVATTGGNW